MSRKSSGGAVCIAAADLCLLALRRGPLIREGRQWRFGRRYFSNVTVKRIIDQGNAVRVGDIIRGTSSSVTSGLAKTSSVRKAAFDERLEALADLHVQLRQQLEANLAQARRLCVWTEKLSTTFRYVPATSRGWPGSAAYPGLRRAER